jgi:hypothetical protein
MRFLRLALLSIIFLFLVIWGLSLFIPSHITLSKAINIKAPADSVDVMISNPMNWKYWYPAMDSTLPFYEKGALRGMIINPTDSIHPVYLLVDKVEKRETTALFTGGSMNPVVNNWRTIEHQGTDSLTLQWSMDFDLRWYPWEKFASLALEKTYAPKMEQGLMELKKKVQGAK